MSKNTLRKCPLAMEQTAMKELIITDLTRFKNPDIVCIAATDPATGEFFRPQPYIPSETCKEYDLQPGTVITGELILQATAKQPHVEDSSWEELDPIGRCTKKQFQDVLELTLSDSISEGFDVEFTEQYQKHIEQEDAPECSIITIKIPPANFRILEDRFNEGKIKASFTDNDGTYFSYLSITDRRFYDFAQEHYNDGKLDEVTDFIHEQDELYLRVGLSRYYEAEDGRAGYWLQVNGIYTFPSYMDEIEAYG